MRSFPMPFFDAGADDPRLASGFGFETTAPWHTPSSGRLHAIDGRFHTLSRPGPRCRAPRLRRDEIRDFGFALGARVDVLIRAPQLARPESRAR